MEELDQSPVHLLHRAGQCAGLIFSAEMKDGGLTPRQLAVMRTLGKFEGISQTDIVDKTGIDRSTLAAIVRRLQKKGLLQRRRTREDARAYAIKLSEEGRKLLRNAEPLAQRADERLLLALPAAQRKAFMAGLQVIVNELQRLSSDGEKQST